MKINNGFFGKLFSQESSITDVLQVLKYVSRFYILLVYLLACLTFSCIMLKMAKHTKKHTNVQKNGVHTARFLKSDCLTLQEKLFCLLQ